MTPQKTIKCHESAKKTYSIQAATKTTCVGLACGDGGKENHEEEGQVAHPWEIASGSGGAAMAVDDSTTVSGMSLGIFMGFTMGFIV